VRADDDEQQQESARESWMSDGSSVAQDESRCEMCVFSTCSNQIFTMNSSRA
jgi:hypothetical protein